MKSHLRVTLWAVGATCVTAAGAADCPAPAEARWSHCLKSPRTEPPDARSETILCLEREKDEHADPWLLLNLARLYWSERDPSRARRLFHDAESEMEQCSRARLPKLRKAAQDLRSRIYPRAAVVSDETLADLKVDGKEVPAGDLRSGLVLDLGTHEVQWGSGAQVCRQRIDVREEPLQEIRLACDPLEQARILYEQAGVLYDANDAIGALRLMEQSYELSHSDELFYNLADLKRQLGRPCPALGDYRHYLEKVPKGAHREEAKQAIEGLACPEAQPSPIAGEGETVAPSPTHRQSPSSVPTPKSAPSPASTPTSVPRAPESRWTPVRIGGWAALGAGVTAGVGAVVCLVRMRNTESELRSIENEIRNAENETSRAAWISRYNALYQEGKRYQGWELGLATSGAALAITGGILLVLAHSHSASKPAPVVSVAPERGGAFATYSMPF